MRSKRLLIGLMAAIAVILLIIVYRMSRPVTQEVDQPAPTPSRETLSTSTPAPVPTRVFCERPYTDSSVWNVPIDWSIARIHPMSDLMMDTFFETTDWIGTDTSQYAPNIYVVSSTVPLVDVQLREYRFRDAIEDTSIQYGEPAGIVRMPLPPEARPAVGTDGQLAVINIDTGEEWGLNEGYIDAAGNWFAGGAYRYSVENSGIPAEGFGQRGAGIGQLAGMVRRCEVDNGRIEHAVTIAYDYPCEPDVCQLNDWPASIPPFRKTDGKGTSPYDIPEGTRLAIRPEITQKQIEGACAGLKGCIVWTRTMQEYGGFVVDNSGHPKTYAEGNATANWEPSVWTEDMLRDIPSDWYVVIDWDHPSTKAP